MGRWAFAGLVIIAAGCGDDRLLPAPECGTPCYPGPDGTAGVGSCAEGLWSCAGREPACVGALLPQPETCDGLDGDCDGVVPPDELDLDGDGLASCQGDCDDGDRAIAPGAGETCNGRDDDCDGGVDEELPASLCYEGPEEALRFGECRAGVTACIDGRIVCDRQVLPRPESCDGRDEDCDGVVDDSLATTIHDVVLVIDESGSMLPWLQQIQTAALELPALFAEARWRFALVASPASRPDPSGDVLVLSDFTSSEELAIVALREKTGDDPSEPTWDVLADLADPANPLGLSWSDGDRLVVLFTDEAGQSYRHPPVRPEDVEAALRASGIELVVFGSPEAQRDLEPLAAATGGAWFELTQVLARLVPVIRRGCE